MLKLDNTLLEEIGLGSLPDPQKRQMLQHIYDTLELRVGTHLANQMTDKQLEEFEKFIDAGGDANQAQALQWLETNLPNYKQVVQDTFEALKAEVKQMAPQLLAAAAAQPQEAQVVSQPVPSDPGGTMPQQPAYGQPPAPTQPNYPSPTSQPVGAPSPQQVMPSQQAPVDASQSWQQPPAYAQPPAAPASPAPDVAFAPPQQPFAASSPVSQPQQPIASDPFAAPATPQPSATQFGQPQDTPQTAPAAASPWQPPTPPPSNPTDSAWQPRPTTGQQPPQGTV